MSAASGSGLGFAGHRRRNRVIVVKHAGTGAKTAPLLVSHLRGMARAGIAGSL